MTERPESGGHAGPEDVDGLIAAAAAEGKLLVDPYDRWIRNEGVPIVEDFGVDLLALEVAPWARLGVPAAVVHLLGRGDNVNVVLAELPPGGATIPQQHLYEEVVYVLSGHGTTTVERPDGREHTFEWGPCSLFGLPINARHRHFNASGSEPSRLASVTSLPLVMKTFRQEEFIFDNPWAFEERFGKDERFAGEGDYVPVAPGRHMWETNFVPDLRDFALPEWAARGSGSRNLKFVLADSTMHAHVSEMPVGTYKKGHRHGPDFHVFTVEGHGYSLLWYEGDKDFERIDWRHGVVYAPPDQMFHQHFNTSGAPVRYLAVAYGGLRYPFTDERRRHFLGVDKSVDQGGRQIDYVDEDPRIRTIYLDELEKEGVECMMETAPHR